MFEKIKDFSSQVATQTNCAVNGMSASIKGGAKSLGDNALEMADGLNDKVVRASTAQMCRMLEIAIDELKTSSLSSYPISLTATATTGLASLEMQVHLHAEKMGEKDSCKSVGTVMTDISQLS